MAARVQKDLFIAHDDLRDHYKHQGNTISSLCKAIEKSTQTTIQSQLMRNGTVKFELIGGKGGTNKAKRSIVGQFCKKHASKKYIDEPKETVIRSSQEAMKTLHEPEQLQLLKEGKRFLLTEAALNKFNLLTGASELREFACASCDRFWWRVVPRTKPVSRCRGCKQRYDALPRDKEFGIGRYLCTECGHSFNKRCTATDTFFCYKCKSEVRTPYIHPKFLPTTKPPPMLFEPLPFIPSIRPPATEPPSVPYEPPKTKPPPKFKTKKVIHASTLHESTGSTISTILTQNEDYDYKYMTMSDSSSESGDSDNEEYPATSEAVDTTDTECYSDTEAWSGSESGHPIARLRISASDSESDFPDSEDQDASKKPLVTGSDSGIGSGTASNSKSSSVHSMSGSYASAVKGPINPLSSIEVKGDFPGVIFSKHCEQQSVDRNGATIKGEGITLFVPEGAVPSTDQVEISLQGCLGGPFVLPCGYIFASPVFLISPPFAFHKKVVLKINHFACLESEEDFEDMIFVSSSTKPIIDEASGEASWCFHLYDHYGSPQFQLHSGEIHLKHFCFAGFARKKKTGLRNWYSVSLYTPLTYGPSLSCHAIFSVTLQHEVFTKNLERFLEKNFKNEAFRQVCVSIRSNTLEEEIELTIPKDSVSDQGYRIVPDIDPCKIFKDQIDYALECKKRAIKDIANYPPRIVLTIQPQTSSAASLEVTMPVPMQCSLGVTGIARTPPLTFNLLVDPTTQSDYSSQSSIEGGECSGNEEALGTRHLHKISSYLKEIDNAEIIRLGGALGLYYSRLLCMNQKLMAEDMVAAWIRGEDSSKGPPSWSILVSALEEIGQTGTARKIRGEQL